MTANTNATTAKVVSPETLLERLDDHRRQQQQIVTTNGCFDILHVGHLRYLQAARQAGDLLVVLLNSDASVRQLKGPHRPIVPQAERAELLAGLSCVDYVVLFDEESPQRLLETLRPDIHVKGGDYTAQTLPEAPVLEKMGTRLHFIPFIPGCSSTNIIQRILELNASPQASGGHAAS